MKFKFSKRARIHSSLFAGCAFIALAVYGWGLPLTTVFVFLAICLVFLAVIVAVAAGLGWLLSVLRERREGDPLAVGDERSEL